MSDIKGKYNKILEELEASMKDRDDLAIAKEKFMELTVVFMDIVDRLTFLTDERIKEIENKQEEINRKINNVQSIVDTIEEDIYDEEDDEDDNFEFEIVCPYCNYEFTTDITDEEKNEIKCPQCNNIIELDWNSDEESSCDGNCSHCHGAVAEDEEKYNKKDIKNNNEEEEDM